MSDSTDLAMTMRDRAGWTGTDPIVSVLLINGAKALEEAEREVAELREALERIAARGIYSVNGGHACATCRAFWHPDPVVINFQSERHYDRCAYVIAREALKPHAQEHGSPK